MSDLIKFAGLRILIAIILLIAAILIYQNAEPKLNNDFWSFALSVSIPLLVLGGLASLVLANRFNKDFMALSRREEQKLPDESGWVAVSGNIVSENPSDKNEFGGLVAFRYQILDEQSAYDGQSGSRSGRTSPRKRHILRAEGFYQMRLAINNDHDKIRICGFLDLRHLERSVLENDVLRKCRATAIRQPKWVPKVILRKLAFTNVTSSININWIFSDYDETSDSSCNAKSLTDGDLVHAFGRRHNNQLFPSEFLSQGISVYSGTTEELLVDLKEDGQAFKITGVICLAVSAGLSLFLLLI